MLPPPVKTKLPVLGMLKRAAQIYIVEEVRSRLDELSEEKAGFAYRALEAHHRELKRAGREWDEEQLGVFLNERLPAALRAAEEHQAGRQL